MIKRYTNPSHALDMIPSDDGEYVAFEDVARYLPNDLVKEYADKVSQRFIEKLDMDKASGDKDGE